MTITTVHHADNANVLPLLSGFDACVTDPPYELSFMGRAWDGTGIAYRPEFWASVLAVLKPGAHLVAFGGTRTSHRMVCAIEDAGFEIRDSLMWVYGSGFPKSHNLPGGIGTALKPAHEPIVLARKPLIGTVAANVLAHGTGGLNIDASRVVTDPQRDDPRLGGKGSWGTSKMAANVYEGGYSGERVTSSPLGRWPANVLHDGSDEVEAAFATFGERPGQIANVSERDGMKNQNVFGAMRRNPHEASANRTYTESGGTNFSMKPGARRTDTGTASRFFYCAKASSADRAESKHPTVKPLALLKWLCNLVTPPGGRILDPFAGSGTTLQAAVECGFSPTGIEREAEYFGDIVRRLQGRPVIKITHGA